MVRLRTSILALLFLILTLYGCSGAPPTPTEPTATPDAQEKAAIEAVKQAEDEPKATMSTLMTNADRYEEGSGGSIKKRNVRWHAEHTRGDWYVVGVMYDEERTSYAGETHKVYDSRAKIWCYDAENDITYLVAGIDPIEGVKFVQDEDLGYQIGHVDPLSLHKGLYWVRESKCGIDRLATLARYGDETAQEIVRQRQ